VLLSVLVVRSISRSEDFICVNEFSLHRDMDAIGHYSSHEMIRVVIKQVERVKMRMKVMGVMWMCVDQ
jgi:hypothetical protein